MEPNTNSNGWIQDGVTIYTISESVGGRNEHHKKLIFDPSTNAFFVEHWHDNFNWGSSSRGVSHEYVGKIDVQDANLLERIVERFRAAESV